ncbi:N-acetylmuramoyl-L-alanine amidase [Flavobacterium arsenatis]|uniref:N-acetylmuramoyl-L-alanine amidase n=1 Tax=Flavobacterium arsenatis TaxID=1484332 RepID=A0ABU1TQQ1_9FLAO|nr:N-acetylmuramoyl-L-alanine amidase [Flavobacterium arsenatis]MDR6968299.1 N-acetylmuramoyl-L-alanine amidase [Flavobacterium arsenatis]
MKNTFKIILALVVVGSCAFINPKDSKSKQITVVIDAGHGGKDHGITAEEFSEKEIIQKISNNIKAQNEDQEIVIHFTRTDDEFVSLKDRTDYINKIKPDLVLSLHVNAVKNENASGIEFFINKENSNYEKSKAIAEKLNEKLVKNHSLKSRGIKEARIYIIEKSEAPAVTVELGFLSNANERKYLTDENEQSRIASTILEFIAELK